MHSSCNFGRMLSVGAIRFEDRFCTSKQGGIGGAHIHDMPCTWRLSWLSVERPWSALVISLDFSTNRCRNRSYPLQGYHFWHCRQFLVTEVFAAWRVLTIVSSLMSGWDEVMNPQENWWKPMAQVSSVSSQQKWKIWIIQGFRKISRNETQCIMDERDLSICCLYCPGHSSVTQKNTLFSVSMCFSSPLGLIHWPQTIKLF